MANLRWSEKHVSSDVVTVWEEYDADKWQTHDSKLSQEIETPRDSTTVIFASSDAITKRDHLRESELLKDFWTVIADDLNGSFCCNYITDEEEQIVRHISWSCFKTKHATKKNEQPVEPENIKYNWKQFAILVHWFPQTGQQIVVFLNLPEQQWKDIQIPSNSDRKSNPYVWHTAFADQAKEIYNHSVWSMRDLVRDVEKQRDEPNNPAPEFPKLHDIARHISHANENLEVALHTIDSVIQEQRTWRVEYAVDKKKPLWIQNQQRLRFIAKELHSQSTRCRSLSDRMKNEINLAFNLVSQKFGRNAQSDSAMMKTIALVSLIYLPATFVSGLFGMNFFNLSDDNGQQLWIMSDNFWLYWAITIPLTILTVIIWAIWHYSDRITSTARRIRHHDIV
ncbi:hypothetical protein AWENTII_006762 [Aspergillus wentii]|nr:hypothetical protein MW887_006518 [Aspergillus wentii]